MLAECPIGRGDRMAVGFQKVGMSEKVGARGMSNPHLRMRKYLHTENKHMASA